MGGRRHAHAFDHHNMVGGPAASSVITVVWRTEDGIMKCYGTTAATSLTDTDTYAPGCEYTDVNLAKLYVNAETDPTAAASFGEAT